MFSRWRLLSFSMGVFACVSTMAAEELPGAGADTGKTVVYRDTWGVPHIYAPTVEEGLYAMGWAQAQDRPEELLKNFMRAMGEAAKFDGPGAIQSDMVSHLWDHYGTSKRHYDKIRPDIQGQMQAYVKGMNDFYAEHPEDVPLWWGDRQIDEHMVVAFGRFFLYGWSIGQVFGDLRAGHRC